MGDAQMQTLHPDSEMGQGILGRVWSLQEVYQVSRMEWNSRLSEVSRRSLEIHRETDQPPYDDNTGLGEGVNGRWEGPREGWRGRSVGEMASVSQNTAQAEG